MARDLHRALILLVSARENPSRVEPGWPHQRDRVHADGPVCDGGRLAGNTGAERERKHGAKYGEFLARHMFGHFSPKTAVPDC